MPALPSSPLSSAYALFEQSSVRFPGGTAVVDETRLTTYAELAQRVARLSTVLLAQAPGKELIGVSTAGGLGMVVSVLAILRAGKGYVPLDPAYPAPRLRQMVTNASLRHCLAPAAEAAAFTALGLHVLVNDQDDLVDLVPASSAPLTDPAAAPGPLAYVLYTSGSTGEPKGVGMGHAALLNLLHWQQAHSNAGPGTRTLQFAPLSFDVSFQEIFATLGTGGTLVLLPEARRRDLSALLDFMGSERIQRAFLPFVALQHLAGLAASRRQFPTELTEVMTAGEQLKITPQVAAFFTALPGCTLYNQYGPTECHVVTQLVLTGDPAAWERLPPIGQPIANTSVHLLTPALEPVPAGEVGELCIGGECLATGYLGQPERTAEKFIAWTPPTGPAMRLYRSGDLARLRPDGELEFLGRQDEQVKIRGHRVELGEVEALLAALPAVGQVAVVAHELPEGDRELVAYVVPAGPIAPDPAALRRAAAAVLPAYMLPAAFVTLAEFPKTSSGKIDRRALPAPAIQPRAALDAPYHVPRTAPERQLATVWARLLRLDQVGTTDDFFELGGTSLLAQQAVAQLRADFGYELPVTRLYQFPTVAAAARYLTEPAGADELVPAPALAGLAAADATGGEVAIIGMAGRFPGAETLAELWDVLREGRETTRFFRAEELDASLPAGLRHDPLYVPARGIIDHADEFEPAFFKLNARLAAAMDPQQRVFLEIAWEVLEQGGYLPAHYAGRVGVFAGCGNNSYYPHNVQGHAAALEQLGEFQVMTVNEKDYVATRVAYALDLRGPAVSVHAACSTGLLAVAQAVQSLRAGQCEVALAGAASITAPLHSGYLHQAGAMLSPDGHCRPFDAQAGGTVFSDGAGVVLLKPLAAARRDGDPVYAVIRGVGVSNDGGGKSSFSAPSAAGQAAAIGAALADGRVAPASIGYVEAHGTGTPLGDPIEVDGLRQAFGPGLAAGSCGLGSIKSNFGHLTAAAGVAGLIKTVLALQHRQLPGTLHYHQPNPHLNLAGSPFCVTSELRDWPAKPAAESAAGLTAEPAAEPRRAGISSFGVGGTNVHIVVEESGDQLLGGGALADDHPAATRGRPVQLVAWSARTANSSVAYARRLRDFLAVAPVPPLADVAFTLHTTRAPLAERRFVVATDGAGLRAALAQPVGSPGAPVAGRVAAVPGAVVFLFPGQGAQYANMGRALYEHEPVYRAVIDECAGLLRDVLDVDLRHVLYPPAPDAATLNDTAEAALLQDTRYAQPALFATEYALARLWQSWGVRPTAVCGHSLGEFVAACVAGVFGLEDALRLVAGRGRLVSALPPGQMMAVRATAAEVQALLPAGLDVAAINSRKSVVVAGTADAVAAFADTLAAQNIPHQRLATNRAFHSAMMEPAVAEFEQLMAGVRLAAPALPLVSSATGTWLTAAQATDPAYWAAQLRAPVQFAAALDTLLAEPDSLLLEVGPGNTLATLARQQAAGRLFTALPGLPPPTAALTDFHALLETLGRVWLSGLEPDWRAFYAGQARQRRLLPAYAFDRQRCWLDPPVPTSAGAGQASTAAGIDELKITLPALASAPAASADTLTVLPAPAMRQTLLLQQITALLAEATDVEVAPHEADHSFLELGLDSLGLTQVALNLRKVFQVPITFRQLNESVTTPAALAAYLDAQLPAEAPPRSVAAPIETPAETPATATTAAPDSALSLITAQLELLTRQVALLHGPAPMAAAAGPVIVSPAPPAPLPASLAAPTATPILTPEETLEHAKPFGATARIERRAVGSLTASQQEFLTCFTARYNHRTAASKAFAQQHRPHMADPRVVTGFSPLLKELTYPLVVERSAGCRLWDLDGHEYVDALNGFGSSLFGYQPAFIKEVLHEQLERGYEVGPQHALAGEVSQLLCELTGLDRAALCSTGSEAVLGALRVARTTTGRSLVVAFTGAYHGINDEVIVRGTRQLRSRPAAPGIPAEAVQNMLILDYGTEESLRIIAERAPELAAVLVEPVQSRRADFQPAGFLRELRRLTAEAGVVLIFDEVITGFRMAQGGAQAMFGVRADLATYGKVIGGGLPIGAIAGRRELMDALDGGAWQFGDASVPEVGVTYFAGTFVRHPLALAAAAASLRHLRAEGPALQEQLNATTADLVAQLNAEAAHRQLPLVVVHCGSLWKIKFTAELPHSTLLFTLMREKGVHIWDNFPCFLTTAHTAADIEVLVAAFAASLAELVAAGFLPGTDQPAGGAPEPLARPTASAALNQPPVPGARLGRDATGNPAWFLPNPVRPGQFVQLAAV